MHLDESEKKLSLVYFEKFYGGFGELMETEFKVNISHHIYWVLFLLDLFSKIWKWDKSLTKIKVCLQFMGAQPLIDNRTDDWNEWVWERQI